MLICNPEISGLYETSEYFYFSIIYVHMYVTMYSNTPLSKLLFIFLNSFAIVKIFTSRVLT